MNKKTTECQCGPDCKCDPCDCSSSSNGCENGKQHTGSRFWFWAFVRILVVVGIIVGAFVAGVRMGYGDFLESIGKSRDYRPSFSYRNAQHMNHKTTDTMRQHTMMPTRTGSEQFNRDPESPPLSMGMDDMTKMLIGKTGDDLDKAFLEMMIPHHEGAINMAKYLTGSKHPELQKMGQDIITTQTTEIEQMKQWMKDWGYTQ